MYVFYGLEYLTDSDDYIKKLTEEESKSIFVELVVDILTIVPHESFLLLSSILYHPVETSSNKEAHHTSLHG